MIDIRGFGSLFFLFFKKYRINFKGVVKFGLLVAVLAYFSVLTSLSSIIEFTELGPLEAAKFDVLVNDFVPEAVLAKWADKAEILKGARIGDAEIFTENRFAGRTNLLLVDGVTKALEITEINKKYLKRGKIAADGAVMDEGTAVKLKVGVGDTIKVKIGNTVTEYKVTALLYPTYFSKDTILAYYPPAVKEFLSPNLYSVFWLRAKENVSSENFIRFLGEAKYPVELTSREGLLKARLAQLESLSSLRSIQFVKFGAVIIFAIFVLRDALFLLKERQKDYALLMGLGISRYILTLHFVGESFIKSLAIVFMAVLGGKLFINYVSGYYYPLETMFAVFGYLFGLAVVVSLITAFIVFNRMKKIPVATLLAEAEV